MELFCFERRDFWACLVLIALIAIVFGQALTFDFIRYDDGEIIYAHPQVHQGLTWSTFVWSLTHFHFYLYIPITTLTHLADMSLYGDWASGHHLTSLLFHGASAVLLYLALVRMTGNRWSSFFVAAVFAVHPLRASSVVWLASRKDVTSGMFFMLVLLSYASYARRPSLVRYVLVAFVFTCGLLCKPILTTVPCVLLLLDWWPLERIPRSLQHGRETLRKVWWLCIEKIPLLMLSACASFISFRAETLDTGYRTADAIPLTQRLGDAALNYTRYIYHLLDPRHVSIHFPPLDFVWTWPQVAGACIFLGSVSLFVVYFWRRRYLAVGWFWFLGMFIPVIGLVRYDHAPYASRHTYLATIGLLLLLGWGVPDLIRGVTRNRTPHYVLASFALGVVGVLTAFGVWQVSFWRNTETVFQRALAVTERNDVAHKKLGRLLLEKNKPAEALAHFQAAIKASPANSDGYYQLGSALFSSGQYREAAENLALVVRFVPEDIDAQALYGRALLCLKQYPQALDSLGKAANAWSDDLDTQLYYAIALERAGRADQARDRFDRVEKIAAGNAQETARMAFTAYTEGCLEAASRFYVRALSDQPGNPVWHFNLGSIQLEQGRLEEAVVQLTQAVDLQPDNVMAQVNLGLAMVQLNRAKEALPHFQEAVRIQPKNAACRIAYGAGLAADGNLAAACEQFSEAVSLEPNNATAREHFEKNCRTPNAAGNAVSAQ